MIAVASIAALVHYVYQNRSIPKAIPLTLGAIVAVKGLLEYRPDIEVSLTPFDWMLNFQPILIFIFGSTFLVTAAYTYVKRRERMAVLVLAAVVYLYGAYALLPLGLPDRFGDDRVVAVDHHCRQSTLYTCGPTACMIALGYYDVIVTERKMATACLTTNRGTTMIGAYRGLRIIGMKTVSVKMEQLTPAMLMKFGLVSVVQSGNHMVCLVGTGDGVILHDPLHDKSSEWSQEDIEDRVSSVGIIITPLAQQVGAIDAVTRAFQAAVPVKNSRRGGLMSGQSTHTAAARFLTLRSPTFQLPSTMSLQSTPVGHGPTAIGR